MKNIIAGPGRMPVSVLERIQHELKDYAGSGLSVMEWSHRSEPIVALLERVQEKLHRLLKLPSSSQVLLLQGGGSMQFHMVPMNVSREHDPVDYVGTGIPDPVLAGKLSADARLNGFLGLDGHRCRGGFRASLYSAVTQEDVSCLVDFIRDFESKA